MKIIFFSNKCEKCTEIIKYIDSINISFKMINIDDKYSDNEYSNIMSKIDNNLLPYLIDTELNQPIKGNIVYEYLKNLKFFNISTNNIDNIIPNNPIIDEDNKALLSNKNLSNIPELLLNNNQNLNQEIIKENNINNIKNKKFKYYLIKKK